MTDAGGCGSAVPVAATGGVFALAPVQMAFLAPPSTGLMVRMAVPDIGGPIAIPAGAIATEPPRPQNDD